MKKLIMMVLGLMVAVGMAGMAIAGNIDSPGAPSAGSGMYTLQQVYDYMTAGTVPTIPGSFQEPSTGPGSTMKTTNQIVQAVATPFAQANGPAAADVKDGVKFFSTASGNWGVKTGALICPTPIPDWYTTYGPAGQDKVVKIGNLYVAKWTNNPGTRGGCRTGGNGGFVTNFQWSINLNWLGVDWRLPTKTEATNVICPNRALLGAYCDYWAWCLADDSNLNQGNFYAEDYGNNAGYGEPCHCIGLQATDNNPAARVVRAAF